MTSKRTVREGRGVSTGVAMGRPVCVSQGEGSIFRFPVAPELVENEILRLHAAVERTRKDLATTKNRVSDLLGEELAEIFQAHDLILMDRLFLGEVEQRIRRDLVNAEWAVEEVAAQLGERFARIETEHLRERGDDLRDVTRYLLRSLRGIEHHEFSEIEGDAIVVADELTPTETIRLARQGVAGLVLEAGGQNSHTAIIAGALNLPLVLGVGPLRQQVHGERVVIVDADNHRVIVNPGAREQGAVRRRLKSEALGRPPHAAPTTLIPKCVTKDGKRIRLLANIELLDELPALHTHGCEGVGLYRSEFLFIEKSPDLPSEEEQLEAFKAVLAGGQGNDVIVRTFDLGGRTLSRQLLSNEEENPSLGLRGIRLTLKRLDLFRTQLRALLRASVFGKLHIMVPMVSNLEEVQEFRRLLTKIARELRAEGHAVRRGIPVGIMIETPAAALIADRLAREVDFFAIGTNDLVQYTLAVDRNNEQVADLYQPLHPAILALIAGTASSARRGGCAFVEVCGEMAARPEWVPLLVGAGITHLSMSPRSIADVRAVLEELDTRECKKLLREAVACSTQAQVLSLLSKFHERMRGPSR